MHDALCAVLPRACAPAIAVYVDICVTAGHSLTHWAQVLMIDDGMDPLLECGALGSWCISPPSYPVPAVCLVVGTPVSTHVCLQVHNTEPS